MKYIRAEWNETRGDQFDHWGRSIWYIELDDLNYPNRQIEVYQSGIRLKYGQNNIQDLYGSLGDQPIEAEDGWGKGISRTEFEEEWKLDSFNELNFQK